jgi:hypothetical protein
VNSLVERYPLHLEYQSIRKQMMPLLTDEDLLFSPGGSNPTLGELCRVMGEVQRSYIDSFKTFKQDWSYRHPDPSIAGSVARLTEWFDELDAELQSTIAGLSEEDVERPVDRGWPMPARLQLEVYKEALLIFYGKASVSLKCLGKELTEQWRGWIA